jgi:hypothetical protein
MNRSRSFLVLGLALVSAISSFTQPASAEETDRRYSCTILDSRAGWTILPTKRNELAGSLSINPYVEVRFATIEAPGKPGNDLVSARPPTFPVPMKFVVAHEESNDRVSIQLLVEGKGILAQTDDKDPDHLVLQLHTNDVDIFAECHFWPSSRK